MSLEPETLKGVIDTLKPYLVGGLGAIASYVHDMINGQRKMEWLVIGFWVVLGAMLASWMNDEIAAVESAYSITVHGRGPILFFSGGGAVLAYPKVREVFSVMLVGLAERLKAFVEKLK